MSSHHSLLSKAIDALMRVISSAGFVPNRPPQVRCAGGLSLMAARVPRATTAVKSREDLLEVADARAFLGFAQLNVERWLDRAPEHVENGADNDAANQVRRGRAAQVPRRTIG